MPVPIAAAATGGGMSPAAAAVTSQGIQSGSGLFGSIIAGAYNKKRLREAQRFTVQQTENAYARDMLFWNKQNQYNSPLEQRRRLEEAGISPWAMYGQMDTGNAGMVNAPIADTIKPNYITENVDLGIDNPMAAYFAVKQFRMNEAMVAKQLEGEQLKNEYQLLQNGVMQFNLNKLQERYNEEIKEWNRKSDIHSWSGETHKWNIKDAERRENEYLYKIEEYKRQAERYTHESSLWKYDATARQLDIDQRRQNLTKGLYEIAEYPYKYQQYGDRHASEEETLKAQKLERFLEENRQRVLMQYGVDNKLDFTIAKTLANALDKTTRNIKGMFGKKTYYQPQYPK